MIFLILNTNQPAIGYTGKIMKTKTRKTKPARTEKTRKSRTHREVRELQLFFLEDSLTDYQFSYQSQNLIY